MEYNRAALKQEVKNDLRNTRPKAIIVSLVYLLLTFALTLIVEVGQMPLTNTISSFVLDFQWLMEGVGGGFGNERELLLALDSMDLFDRLEDIVVFSSVFGLISSVINWTLTYGYEGYCLSMIRRKDPGFARLLCAFPKWGWVLLTGFLVGLFTTLWTILICILAVLAIVVILLLVEGSWGVTLSIVIMVAAMVWMVNITLRYSMANYILLDEKVDSLEAISRSKDMMRGRKWHLFVLELSFIGWLLLAGVIGSVAGGIASLVVALFSADPYAAMSGLSGGSIAVTVVTELALLPLMMWLQPYMVGSTAKFYNWMKHTDIAHGVWEGRYPKRHQPPDVKIDTDKVPEAPSIPAYEEPAAPQPDQPQTPDQPVPPEQPAAPVEDVPDRPNYE